MRLLLISVLLCSFFTGKSQSVYEANYTQADLQEVIRDLSQRYNFKFSFDPDKAKNLTLSASVTSNDRQEFLYELFKELPFEVKSRNKIVLLIPKKKVVAKGIVLDKQDGTPLPNAHIIIDSAQVAITDKNGRFEYVSSTPVNKIKVSFIGFQSQNAQVIPSSPILIELDADSTVLQPFIFNDYLQYDNVTSKTSRVALNAKQVSSLPTLGQVDLFKSMQLMPGISSTDESSAGLIIRGSPASHNLVLFDGFTIYHLDHFFGIYSTLNTHVISNVDVYKGGFGSEFGGRLSSVIEVTGRQASMNKIHGGVGIDMLSANAHLGIPITKKLSILLGLRGSYTNIIQGSLFNDFLRRNRVDLIENSNFLETGESLEINPSISFYDFYSKLSFRPSVNEKIDMNLFTSSDLYSGSILDNQDSQTNEIRDEANWGNAGLSITWEKYFGKNWSHKLVSGYSGYFSSSSYQNLGIINSTDSVFTDFPSFSDTSLFENYAMYNDIEDFTLKYALNKKFNELYNADIGLEFSSIATGSEFRSFDEPETFEDTFIDQFAINVSNNLSFNRLNATLGVRLQTYDQADFSAFEPRLGMRYSLTKSTLLKGSYSIHHQFMHQLSLTPFGNSDQFFWIAADDEEFPILRSQHIILGGEYSHEDFTFDVELYQKYNTGILAANLSYYGVGDGDAIETYQGENHIKGIDVLLKYKKRSFESWLSYTLSESINSFPNISAGSRFYSDLDQRHELSISNIYKHKNWEFSSVFIFGSGRPYTPAGDIDNLEIYDPERINALRLPSYHRLDLAAKYNFTIGKISGNAGVTLFNLYNRKNVKSRRQVLQIEQVLNIEDLFLDPNFDPENIDYNDFLNISTKSVDILLLGFTPNFSINLSF